MSLPGIEVMLPIKIVLGKYKIHAFMNTVHQPRTFILVVVATTKDDVLLTSRVKKIVEFVTQIIILLLKEQLFYEKANLTQNIRL